MTTLSDENRATIDTIMGPIEWDEPNVSGVPDWEISDGVLNTLLNAARAEERARVGKLREALERIAKLRDTVCEPFIDGLAVDIARTALSEG